MNKIRKISSDDTAPAPARADYGPATVGVDWDDYEGHRTLAVNRAANDRLHLATRDVHHVSTFVDDFYGDALDGAWVPLNGSDAQAIDPAPSAAKNGVVRLTCGNDATTTMAVNGCQLASELNWDASAGRLFGEFRIKVSAITNIVFFVGFTDSKALEMPLTQSVVTLTNIAADAVGFLFDTNSTNDTLHAVGVAGGTKATHENLAIAPVADTWIRLGVEVFSDGTAKFYINGTKTGNTMASAVTVATDLAATVAVFSETTTSHTLDVDYVRLEQSR